MIDIDAVLDIETEDWSTYVLGAVLTSDGDYFSTRNPRELVDRLLAMGGTVWTWNGGLFDTLWLAQELSELKMEWSGNLAGPRVTWLESSGLIVRDAYALCPMTLKKAARIAGIELAKDTGLPCRCGAACGGYCSIRRAMSEADFALVDHYLRRDCEATIAVLHALSAEADRCGYDLLGTVGGSSYRTFSRIAEVPAARWPNAAAYDRARAGYYGGRVEVFRPACERGFQYDINSAYPYALTQVELPVGEMMVVTDAAKAARAYARGKEGIYCARVVVPLDRFIPPLPKRTPAGRVVYPVGAYGGDWTGLELRAAEARGVEVSIESAIVWGDKERVMASALAIGWANRARAKAEGNDSLAAWHKWVCNSFTGKLAEDPHKERILGNPPDTSVVLCECRPGRRVCRCDPWRPLDRDGRVWAAPFYRRSPCAHVHWAAYLTAFTRVQLLAGLELAGEAACYSDTDSIKSARELDLAVGNDLGDWGSEGAFFPGTLDDGTPVPGFEAAAPKVYRIHGEGGVTVRGKGLPGLTAAGFDAFVAGAPHEVARGVMSLKSAARAPGEGGLFQRRKLSRRHHGDGIHYGGRVLDPASGLTFPREYRQILAWEKSPPRSASNV